MSDDDYNDVEMISATIRDNPEAAHKFLVSTPALEKLKASKKKRTRSTNTTPDSPESAPRRPAKKAKKKESDDEDDDEEPPVTIAIYVQIPKNPTLASTKSRKAKAGSTDDDVLKKAPFTIDGKDKYATFLSKLAAILPCRPENIHEQKLTWKPVKPQNGSALPLGGSDGYKIMIQGISARKAAYRMILLTMPAPAPPMVDDMPWPTGAPNEEERANAKFDYSELEPTSPTDSILQQQGSFNKATKPERKLLEKTYPIGNHPHIDPEKRIYHDKDTGYYFDLNISRLGVWASAMAQKQTDEKTPPLDSRFFDARQRITKTRVNAAAPGPALAPPPPLAAPAVPAAAAPASFADLFFATILSQGGGMGALFPHLAPSAPAPPLPPHVLPALDPPQPRTAPPSPIKRHAVTVERFAEIYNIDAVDCTRLQGVGFRPGDPTELSLRPDADLLEAGFTLFGWKRIHNANLLFKSQLAAGTFDEA
ncbi:hypothetical protein DFH06DRAFT_1145747 [Mycena polygramma]|nr:hypothetical protein DFH06DRAFT_1145747 [Mycena polygramma]